MADNHFKINRGISLVPQSSAPANPSNGDIYYDSSLAKFRKYEDGAWSDISGTGRLPSTTVTSNTTLAVNQVYIADSTSKLNFTLPLTATAGDEIIILGANTGGWNLKSNSAVANSLGYENTRIDSSIGTSLTLINGASDYAIIKLRAKSATYWVTEYHTGTAEFVGNYFGDASDSGGVGSTTTISSNTSLGSTTDGDMVVRQYGNLVINSGVTLTTSTRCKGLWLYVRGDLTVNGAISMSSRGANVDPVAAGVSAGGLKVRRFDGVGSAVNSDSNLMAGAGTTIVAAENNQAAINGDGSVFVIPRAGGNGATAVSATGNPAATSGNHGTAGTGGQTGGGASGGASGGNNLTQTSGAGAAGTCFSGGAAGAGCDGADVSATSGSGSANGGPGGNSTSRGYASAGGAGNPGGSPDTLGGAATAGGTGTGGLLILIVKGNVNIGASGSIEAKGAQGGNITAGSGRASSGGGSGGGSILLLHGGTLTNLGSISAAGGPGGTFAASGTYGYGGNGGAGTVKIQQIGE